MEKCWKSGGRKGGQQGKLQKERGDVDESKETRRTYSTEVQDRNSSGRDDNEVLHWEKGGRMDVRRYVCAQEQGEDSLKA